MRQSLARQYLAKDCTRIPKNHPKNLTYDQVLRIFVWILFPKMTLGENDAQFLDFVSEICQYGLSMIGADYKVYNSNNFPWLNY